MSLSRVQARRSWANCVEMKSQEIKKKLAAYINHVEQLKHFGAVNITVDKVSMQARSAVIVVCVVL